MGIHDERIHKEIGKYGAQTAFLIILGITVKVVIEYFIAHEAPSIWLFDFLLAAVCACYFVIRVTINGSGNDERIIENRIHYAMHVLAILIIGLFGEVIVKFFILHSPSKEIAGSLTVFILGMAYFSLQLTVHGLNAPASVAGVEYPSSRVSYKHRTYKNYLVTDLLIALSWIALDFIYPDMLYWIPAGGKMVSAVPTVLIELFSVFLLGFLTDVLLYQIVFKISDKQIKAI